ncbi:MAG: prohibitin family protein [Opitutales bacterium]|nr:prohibitin family protein [Opitutales bacterium]NRA25908.1 prohibitin family protein [Opitutales bacterium]
MIDQQPESLEKLEPDVVSPKKRWDDRVIDIWNSQKSKLVIFWFLAVFFVAYFWNNIFISVRSGEAGVLWRRMTSPLGTVKGTDLKKIYTEGLNIIWPLDKMYVYETRVQERETKFFALSKNGLRIMIHASVRFRPKVDSLPLLHKEVGPEYVDRVVIPEVQSAIRRVIGAYNPDELYGSQGGIINNIVLIAVSEIGERYIQVDDLLIREIRLPAEVAASIESKLREEQRALEYEFRLRRETQEAERKRIEGEGIAKFQEAITAGITDEFLRFKGIEATLKLSESQNAKIVLIGGEGGLPLILNMPEDGQDPQTVLDNMNPNYDRSPNSPEELDASETNNLTGDPASAPLMKQ